jgi:excisionase family DNA binding protein
MKPTLQSMPWRDWPLTLTINDTAHLLGLDRRTVVKLAENGELEEIRFGSVRTRRVSRASIVVKLGRVAERSCGAAGCAWSQ